jgi:hypothetical protein
MRTAHELHKDDRHFVTALARGLFDSALQNKIKIKRRRFSPVDNR